MARNRQDRPNRVQGDPQDIRRVVNGPDGRRYELVGTAKDWKLGTGSVLLDVGAFLWALVRQARGKEWVVVVRRVGAKSDPILTRTLPTREQATETVTELADALECGDLSPPVE